MSLRFLDSNILLRHILNDHVVHSPAAFRLIRDIERRVETVWTTDLVISEVVFVLSNRRTYNRPRAEIAAVLLPIIELPGVKLPRKRLFRRVFELYVGLPDLSYNDAYHAALVEKRSPPELYSYDTDFDQIPTVTRHEP